MRLLSLMVVTILFTACAARPQIRSNSLTISDTLSFPYEKAWQKTLRVLQAQGYSIDSSNPKGGVISVGETMVKLSDRQANCGSFHGISYLNDYRTATYISFYIDLEKISEKATAIRINSLLTASFNAGVGAETKQLSCFSYGKLERNLLDKIQDEPFLNWYRN